ncbi:MAG TPA: ImcF-related family protein [Bryobacteraceae bacterium]|nr:ImcF-related family protein [Bryobacteraceae bacterium]
MLGYSVIGLTVLALIVLVSIYLQKRKKEKQAAAAAAAGEPVAPGGDEISVLIHEAEKKLEAAKLKEGSKVGGLPVFLVMGEPGTTKTSVMLHSGLDPELLAGQVYVAGNVSPTRSANLWFTRKAIFAEAGGALIADTGKWGKLVKRLQPRAAVVRKGEQAPRAALVCFDCENFTRPGASDIVTNAARTLRARLGEVSQAMGINLPVYALFTKTDRLPFFTDYVRNLTNDESTQVLGVTLPMMDRRNEGVYAEQETNRLTGEFERLFRSLADARIEFLAREGDAARLPPEYEFPREFRKVRPALVQFLVDLCRPSQLTVGPFLRGFYFTGVRPIIINEVAPVAAAAPQPSEAAPSGATGFFNRAALSAAAAPAPPKIMGTRKVPQWLFLAHFFNDVLLMDRSAMGASGASTRTSTARRWLMISAASLSFVLFVLFTISFLNNNSLENRVRDAAKAIPAGDITGTDVAPATSMRQLDVIRGSLVDLMKYRRDGKPLFYRWGLYAGDDVYREGRPIYCGDLRQLMLKQTQANMLTYLRNLRSSNAEFRPAYEALRSYLITTSHPEKSDSQLAPVLMRFWLNGQNPDQDRQTLARRQFDFYQQDLLAENPCAGSADTPTVFSAQAYIRSLGGTQRVYLAMLSEADKRFPSINFNKSFPGSEKAVLDPYEVRGAFSKDGWKFMNDAIQHPERYVKGEAWVLGEQSNENLDMGKLSADIRTIYSNEWVDQWTKYLKSAVVLRYGGLKDAATKLQLHSSNLAPLLELSSQASQNTAVEDPAARNFQPVQYVTPPQITDKYIGPANADYINALAQLQSQVDTLAGKPQPAEAELAQAYQVAKDAEIKVGAVSRNFNTDSPVQKQVTELLLAPILYVEPYLKPPDMSTVLNGKGAGLCKQINPILSKYPFNPKGVDSTIPEIDSVFRPKDGAIWQFVDGDLQKFVTRQGPVFVENPSGGVKISKTFLDWLNRVAAFSDASWGEGTPDPKLKFTVKPLPSPDIENVPLTIGGQAFTFPGGDTPAKQYTWPGDSSGFQLNAKFKNSTLYRIYHFDGTWAVFKFVEQADDHRGNIVTAILGSGNPKQATIDDASGHPVTVKLEVIASPPVFDRGYFQTLNCVPTVALK